MCVIVGFTQKTRGREEVLACLDRAYTRGPDMARVAETASGWLGFRRLSIMGAGRAWDAALRPGA